MSFKENLLNKIKINRIAFQVVRSIGPPDKPQRIDREAMQKLLEMSAYCHHRERDMDLYCQNRGPNKQLIFVLDNELKLYHTTIADVALRKSPTIKEMISIRNAFRILNDKDVVVSLKTDTVQRLQDELIQALDLNFTKADLQEIVKDGKDAMLNQYAEGVIESLGLFAEILGYQKAPKSFQMAHHWIFGTVQRPTPGDIRFGPAILYSQIRNTLKLIKKTFSNQDNDSLKILHQVAEGQIHADAEGDGVWVWLQSAALKKKNHRSGFKTPSQV